MAPKPVEMRRIGDAEWRWFGSRTDAAKAFGLGSGSVSKLIRRPWDRHSVRRSRHGRARPAAEKARAPTKRGLRRAAEEAKHAEGATQKANGKWTNRGRGREFDDLDEYRAAKKQRARGALRIRIRYCKNLHVEQRPPHAAATTGRLEQMPVTPAPTTRDLGDRRRLGHGLGHVRDRRDRAARRRQQ